MQAFHQTRRRQGGETYITEKKQGETNQAMRVEKAGEEAQQRRQAPCSGGRADERKQEHTAGNQRRYSKNLP
jgi:hypothetical protein